MKPQGKKSNTCREEAEELAQEWRHATTAAAAVNTIEAVDKMSKGLEHCHNIKGGIKKASGMPLRA